MPRARLLGAASVTWMRPALWGTAAAALALATIALTSGCGEEEDDDRVGILRVPGMDADPLSDGNFPVLDAGSDAARDAKKDVLLPPTGYCAALSPQPRFCDDFDDLDLTNDWDKPPTQVPPSVMGLDDSAFTSAPASFIAATSAVAKDAIGNVSLRKTVLGNVTHAKLSFSARFSNTNLTKGLVGIATLDVSTSHLFTLYLRDGDLNAPAAVLEEQANGVTTRHLLSALPPAGAWTRIVLDLDFVSGKANLSYDAVKGLDNVSITALAGTEATIRLGAVYVYGPTDPFQANFDDVVLDF